MNSYDNGPRMATDFVKVIIADHIYWADVNEADTVYGETALHWAARYGHLATVKLLIEKKADVSVLSKLGGGLTPAGMAARTNHANVLRILIDAGADTKSGCYRMPLLHAAAEQNSVEIAKLLLKCGAERDALCQKTKSTALGSAALSESIEMVEFLLENGADVSSKLGASPLQLAVQGGEPSISPFKCAIIILLLLKNGAQADPTARALAKKLMLKNQQAYYAFETFDFAQKEAQKRGDPSFVDSHLKKQIEYYKRCINAQKK